MKKALITGITGQDGSYLAELLLEKGLNGHAYNIASDIELSNLEVAELISTHFNNKNVVIEHINNRPFNDSRYAVDDKKLRDLGWSPQRSLIEDLPDIVDWYKSNLEWFK